MLYTRRGDTGTTTLFPKGARLPKTDALFDALGTVDELNAHIGLCRAALPPDNPHRALLRELQNGLFNLQAELGGSHIAVSDDAIVRLERLIALTEAEVTNPHGFVVPGATAQSARYDIARTVARRAERALWHVPHRAGPKARVYLNRASSALFALARHAGQTVGEDHPQYIPHAA